MIWYILFMAAGTIIVLGQDSVYHKCKDFPMTDTSIFKFSCDAGKIIIVKSAIFGVTDVFNPPDQCPITNNTCMKETTIAAELCTGRNSCVINQNILLYNESKLSCELNRTTVANFIKINYTCIVPEFANYGDICYFDEDLYNNATVYISSYPYFPDAMGPEANYQCSCLLSSKFSTPANVIIRALLVRLTGAFTTCSERLSITDSEGETKLAFCSPCNNANNITTVPLASNPEILFRRDPVISPYNGKFILEITVLSKSSGSGTLGTVKCGLVGSTMSSSTNVTATSPSYISTTTTSAILSQPNSFSSTNAQNTSSGMTLGSSNMSNGAQQNTMSTIVPSNGVGTPTVVSQTASEKNSISTGGIIGIVLGIVAFLAVFSLAALCAIKSLRSKRKGAQSTELMPSASDPRLDRSSVDKNPDYETTILEVNGLQVNQPKISSQLPNMQENKDPPDHACYNETISNIKPLPDNHDHYEPLRVTNNQQQTYYNQPSENSNYQPLNFS